jgi:hypothetical protein
MDLVYTTQLSREYIACGGRMKHLSQTALEQCDGDWKPKISASQQTKGDGARGRRLRKGEKPSWTGLLWESA